MNEEILTRVHSRLDSIEQRLNRIENIMGGGKRSTPPTPTAPPPARENPSPAPAIAQPIPQITYPEPTRNSSASRIMGSVAVLCFVGAAVFLIKLAISSGWLTPERQVALAALFGGTLVGTGLYFRTKDSGYLSLLSAAGVIVLDLTLVGGFGIYRLYPAEVAVMGVAAVSVLCVYLYTTFHSEWYAVLSVLGAYSSLFLLRTDLDPAALTTYYLVWDLAFALIAFHVQSRTMILLSAYLGLWGYHVKMQGFALPDPDLIIFMAVVQAIQFTLFCITSVAFSVRHKRPFSTGEAWAFFPLLVFFYGIEYWLLYRFDPSVAPVAAVGFTALLYGFYFAAKLKLKAKTLHSASLLSALGSLVLLHAVYWNILDKRWQLWSGPILLVILTLAWKRFSLGKENVCYAITSGFIVTLSLIAVFFGDYPHPLELIALCATYFATFSMMYVAVKKGSTSLDKEASGFFLLLLSFSQYLLGTFRLFVQLGYSSETISKFSPFWVSSSWGIFGLLVLFIARQFKDPVLAKASLFLLACTTLKVLLFDASSSSPLIRIACLLITGVVLYSGGFILRSIKSWK